MPISNNIYYFQNTPENSTTPPIVLLHGAGGNHLSWPPELRRFLGKDVYAPDLPGHGKSKGQGEQTLADYADRIATWMIKIGLNRAFLVGHSMGGGLAMELAARHPHLAIAIGLISSGARLPISDDLLAYTQNQTTFPSALGILRSKSFGPKAPERQVDLAMKRLSEVRPSVLFNDLQACNLFNFTDKLEKIRRPTLVVCGTADQMTPLRFSQFLVSKIEDSELRILQGAGHMVMLEKPKELAAILKDFLKQLKSTY